MEKNDPLKYKNTTIYTSKGFVYYDEIKNEYLDFLISKCNKIKKFFKWLNDHCEEGISCVIQSNNTTGIQTISLMKENVVLNTGKGIFDKDMFYNLFSNLK